VQERFSVKPAKFAALLVMLTSAAGIGAQQPEPPVPTYETATLQALIAEAAATNALIPERLRAYRARVETEMALALTDSAGRERTTQIEQIASEVRWRSPHRYDQRVVGYRSQAIGPTFSLMSMFGGWTTPNLYGNRLLLGVTPAGAGGAVPRETGTAFTIHPLAPQRDTYYTFSGADTVVVLFSRGRRIHVVSVRVTPRPDAPGNAALFTGDMQLDADRKHVVRMRGRTVEIRDGRPVLTAGSGFPGSSGASFIELVNAEIDGEYWLPAYQRTEFHARFALFGGFRVIVRIVSRFENYRTNDSSWTGPEAPHAGHHLTFAPSDSLSRFSDWRSPLGEVSTDVEYADFEDVMPAAWRARSTNAVRFQPETFGEIFRFNRIEGPFTGIALRRDFGEGDSVFSVRGSAGWAWSEQTARGNVTAERRRGNWSAGVRLQRALAHTNDFQPPLSWGATLSALLGSRDDFDYLDRRGASLFVTRWIGLQRRSVARIEVGAASDRAVRQNIARGLFVEGTGFRPNRGIRPGNHVRTTATLELNPQVSGMFVDRGVGARLYYERADGDLGWQRVELRTAARRELGPFQLYARGDAGMLMGEPAPQVLFEIGHGEGLTAYGYKEFVGDRAAMGRAVLGYTFPVLRAPMRLPGGLIAPGLAPGVAAGIHTAWTDISSEAARRAVMELGLVADEDGLAIPLAGSTDGVRGSAELLLTFFSGAMAVGITRPIDHPGPWKFTARIGQGF
jgi:hypothetical protein